MIINLINGKFYIGSSINLERRLKEYFNINHLEFRKKLPICAALLKYGYSNFKLEILEYSTIDETIIKEQYYLDMFKSEYNILRTAGSSIGYKHSPESIAKFKARKFSPETREKIRVKTKTPERIEQLKRLHADPEYQRKRLEHLKRLNNSPEQKEQILKNAKLFGQKIEVFDTLTKITTVYNSMTEATRFLGLNPSTISNGFRKRAVESTI